MYDFTVEMKINVIYELNYTTKADGPNTTKIAKFASENDLRGFIRETNPQKIVQVVQVFDITNRIINELNAQGKD